LEGGSIIATDSGPIGRAAAMDQSSPRPDRFGWPDDVHSNKPHQQYSDFLKSKIARNDRLLVACSDCHEMHGNTPTSAG
jgi:hypothetical protein